MRVVFAGTPHVAVPSLRALVESHHEVAAVITRPDAVRGRGRKSSPSPVARAAEQFGLAVLKPMRLDDQQFVRQLSDIAPDCCPIVAYGGLVPSSLLQLPRYGWLNLHFSLLPAWRGAAPVQHAVLSGDEVTGATTFALEADLDTGPVFGTVTEPVQPTDTSGELLRRLAVSGAALLIRTVDGLESGEVVPVPQPASGVSYAPKLVVDDARVDWCAPALRVDRVIRATTPEPGAWTMFRSHRLKLGVVQPLASDDALPPGSIAMARSDVRVGTGSHPVRLGQVQPTGKQWMPAADWARGVRLDAGDRLL